MPCYVFAWLGQFFGLGRISWSFIISLNLVLMLRYPFKYKKCSAGSLMYI